MNPSGALLAASGGDTVKLFDVTVDLGDPCVLSYSPSPGSHVNSIKWNHTSISPLLLLLIFQLCFLLDVFEGLFNSKA